MLNFVAPWYIFCYANKLHIPLDHRLVSRLFGNGKYNVNNFTDNPYKGTKINSVKMSIKTSY